MVHNRGMVILTMVKIVKAITVALTSTNGYNNSASRKKRDTEMAAMTTIIIIIIATIHILRITTVTQQ